MRIKGEKKVKILVAISMHGQQGGNARDWNPRIPTAKLLRSFLGAGRGGGIKVYTRSALFNIGSLYPHVTISSY